MKDISILKGSVSAYDKLSGKVIFEHIHNVVMAREKCALLLKLLNATSSDIKTSDDEHITTDATSLASGTGFVVSKFKLGYCGSSYPTEAADLTLARESAAFDVKYFDGTESYKERVTDIHALGSDFESAKVIYHPNLGAFARFKLPVTGGTGSQDVLGLGLTAGDVEQYNFLALYNSDGNKRLTQFKFPEINFYSDFQVDFEYRLYI